MTKQHEKVGEKPLIISDNDSRNCNAGAGGNRYITLDASEHQGVVNWTAVVNEQPAGEELDQIFIRSSIGLTGMDDKFVINAEALTTLSQPFGAYHYLNMKDPDCGAQAINFNNAVKPYPYIEALIVDVELAGDASSWPGMTECVMDFIGNVTFDVDFIYTNANTWNNNFNAASCDAVDDINLWVAEYTTAASPGNITCWGDQWNIWQYTNESNWPGVTGAIDSSCENPGSKHIKAGLDFLKFNKPLALADRSEFVPRKLQSDNSRVPAIKSPIANELKGGMMSPLVFCAIAGATTALVATIIVAATWYNKKGLTAHHSRKNPIDDSNANGEGRINSAIKRGGMRASNSIFKGLGSSMHQSDSNMQAAY